MLLLYGALFVASPIVFVPAETGTTVMAQEVITFTERHRGDIFVESGYQLDVASGAALKIGGTQVTSNAVQIDAATAVVANGTYMQAAEVTFTETTGAGTYTGSVAVPAGATISDIVVNGVALWDTTTSATLKVGDVATDNGYYTGVDLKATDLLAGESLSFSMAGGKAGAYIANSQVSPRYSASARTVSGIVTTVGAAGSAGRTRMTVLYSLPTSPTAASKV